MARIDPLRNFRYRLEIDSITQAGFSEVMIAETTIDAVDYREGTDPPHVRKLSRPHQVRQHHAEVGPDRRRRTRSTSSSGTTTSPPASQGASARRSSSSCRTKRAPMRARFVITDAWPIKYDPSDLNAKGNEVMIELLELANEGIERVSVRGGAHHEHEHASRLPDRNRVRAAEGLRRRRRHAAPARHDAPRHGGRRDPAAARSARAAERGVSRGDRPGARDHAARHRCPTSIPA